MKGDGAATARLVLGTAQLGQDYGVANRTGRPDLAMAEEIVRTAWQGGIREFDTAQAYGDSETVLGQCFHRLGIAEQARVVTKLHPETPLDPASVANAVEESLSRLGISCLHGLMLHGGGLFDQWDRGLAAALLEQKEQGLVRRIGVSLYSPEQAMAALKTEGIDFIQIPGNVLERRFESAGVYGLVEQKGKQVYVRSVFLQGLFFLPPDNLPPGLSGLAEPVLVSLKELRDRLEMNVRDMALAYARQAYPKAMIVVGAENPAQVKENVESWRKPCPPSLVEDVRESFQDVNTKILNPVCWHANRRSRQADSQMIGLG